MAVSIKFFAEFKDLVGTEEITMELNGSSSLDQLIEDLLQQHPQLDERLEQCAIAINCEQVQSGEQSVHDGDEVAIMPPFGGGQKQTSKPSRLIQFPDSTEKMNLDTVLDAIQRPANGGLATFTGSVRATNNDRDVRCLSYEVYESMAKDKLHEIIIEANERWNDRGELDVAVAHRVGTVAVGEPSVMVAVGSPHRAEALEACRYIIDQLKLEVPIWKKEVYENGESWIENPGQQHGGFQ